MNTVESLTRRLAQRERWFADASKDNRKLKQTIQHLETRLCRKDDAIHYLHKEVDRLIEYLLS